MDRGTWWVTIYRVTELDTTKATLTYMHTYNLWTEKNFLTYIRNSEARYENRHIWIYKSQECLYGERPNKNHKYQNEKKDVCTRFKRGGVYNMQNLNIVKNKSNNLRESQ